MLFQRLIPPIHIPRAVVIRFDRGEWACLFDQCVEVGAYVQRYEDLLGIQTEGILLEGISSPVSGMVRWVIPHIEGKRVGRGDVLAVVQADESPENVPFLTVPRPVTPSWVEAIAPVEVSVSGRVRRGFTPPDPANRTAILPRFQTDEIEYITFDSPPVQNTTPRPFPYDLNGKATPKTYRISEEEVAWINKRAGELKADKAQLLRCMIAHFAGYSDAEQASLLASYNLRRKAK